MKSTEELLLQLVKDELIYLVEHPDVKPKQTRKYLQVFYTDDLINLFFDNKKFDTILEKACENFDKLVKKTITELKQAK